MPCWPLVWMEYFKNFANFTKDWGISFKRTWLDPRHGLFYILHRLVSFECVWSDCCCSFGLYGAATSKFELANTDAASQLDGVQNTIGSALNGVVFFLGGASATNFLIRAAPLLEDDFLMTLCYIPVIYFMVFGFRFISIAAFNGIFKVTGMGSLSFSSIPFITVGGVYFQSILDTFVIVCDSIICQCRSARCFVINHGHGDCISICFESRLY